MGSDLNNTISKSFLMMFFGLLISGITAWFTYSTNALETIITGNTFNLLLLLELGVVIIFSSLFRKLSPNAVKLIFFIYAVINGLTLSVIFAVYELNSIISLFLISALGFGALAYIGKNTTMNLTRFGTYLTISLLCGFILSLLNIFVFHNSTFELVLDWVMLFVFFGVTIYDVNKIHLLDFNIDEDKLYIYIAMDLYLDFINIFLRLLSLFGKEKK